MVGCIIAFTAVGKTFLSLFSKKKEAGSFEEVLPPGLDHNGIERFLRVKRVIKKQRKETEMAFYRKRRLSCVRLELENPVGRILTNFK